jgi:hypothetical protein
MAGWEDLAPRIDGAWISHVFASMRPVLKTLIKGGLIAYDKTNEFLAEAGEQWDDLLAEVRAEIAADAAVAQSHHASQAVSGEPAQENTA